MGVRVLVHLRTTLYQEPQKSRFIETKKFVFTFPSPAATCPSWRAVRRLKTVRGRHRGRSSSQVRSGNKARPLLPKSRKNSVASRRGARSARTLARWLARDANVDARFVIDYCASARLEKPIYTILSDRRGRRSRYQDPFVRRAIP